MAIDQKQKKLLIIFIIVLIITSVIIIFYFKKSPTAKDYYQEEKIDTSILDSDFLKELENQNGKQIDIGELGRNNPFEPPTY